MQNKSNSKALTGSVTDKNKTRSNKLHRYIYNSKKFETINLNHFGEKLRTKIEMLILKSTISSNRK